MLYNIGISAYSLDNLRSIECAKMHGEYCMILSYTDGKKNIVTYSTEEGILNAYSNLCKDLGALRFDPSKRLANEVNQKLE